MTSCLGSLIYSRNQLKTNFGLSASVRDVLQNPNSRFDPQRPHDLLVSLPHDLLLDTNASTNLIHCGIGRFCFPFLARILLTLNVFRADMIQLCKISIRYLLLYIY